MKDFKRLLASDQQITVQHRTGATASAQGRGMACFGNSLELRQHTGDIIKIELRRRHLNWMKMKRKSYE
jgi:hypothetical protein